MGCSILNMLYHLNLYLLEVLFVYTIKMSQKEVFSLSAHIPSLQLVTRLPDSTKGTIKGHIVVSSPWVGSYEHLAHAFEPRRLSGISYSLNSIVPFSSLPSRSGLCKIILSS